MKFHVGKKQSDSIKRKPLHTQRSGVCEGRRRAARWPPASGVSRVNVAAVGLPGREGFVPVPLSRTPPPQGQVLGPQTSSLQTLPGLFSHRCVLRTHSALRCRHGGAW